MKMKLLCKIILSILLIGFIYPCNIYPLTSIETAETLRLGSGQGSDTLPRMSGMINDLTSEAGKAEVVRLVEQQVSMLESRDLDGDFDGVSYVSGMSSISAMFFHALEETNVNPNEAEIILYRPAYGCTDNLSDEIKALAKVKIVTDLSQLKQAVNDNTVLVFFESPANPSLKIVDIEKAVNIVKNKNSDTIVGFDNTFATSLGQQPLKFGVDICMVGLTKGQSGSGDVLGAVLIAKKDIADRLREKRDVFSEELNHLDALKTVRYGLPLLGARLKKKQDNAFTYVDFLKRQKGIVKSVTYPGDSSHPQHKIAMKQMDNYGYMISFDLGSRDMAKAFMDFIKYTRLFENAVSLGQIRNLIEWPAGGTHATVSDDDREFGGISDGAIRWAVGIEESEDVLRELDFIFSTLELYKDDLAEIPYEEFNKIFMEKWVGPYGEEEHLLRKFPIVRRDGDDYSIEPGVHRAIGAIENGRDKKAAELIHEATLIDKYDSQNLIIHHAWLWGLLSGDHKSVVASGGGSTTSRSGSSGKMHDDFGSFGLFQKDSQMLQPGQTGIYARLGTPGIVTVETLVSMLEVGIRDALSFKYYGFSTPSGNSAIRQVFLNWMLKTPEKENGNPVKIVVLTSRDTSLDTIAKSYKEGNFSKLLNAKGTNKFEFEIIYLEDEAEFYPNLDGDVDFIFVDGASDSNLDISEIEKMKKITNAKIAWINSKDIKDNAQPIVSGADLSVVILDNLYENIGAVVVVPFEDALNFTFTRKDTSNAMRDNSAHEALLYGLPYRRTLASGN